MKKGHLEIILALLVFEIGFIFYWNQVRPATITMGCHRIAKQAAHRFLVNGLKDRGSLEGFTKEYIMNNDLYLKEDYEAAFQECMRSKGIVNL